MILSGIAIQYRHKLSWQGSSKRTVRDRLVQICHSQLHYMAAIGGASWWCWWWLWSKSQTYYSVDPDNQESRRKKGIEEILLQVLCHEIAHTCYISFLLFCYLCFVIRPSWISWLKTSKLEEETKKSFKGNNLTLVPVLFLANRFWCTELLTF